MSRRLTTRSPSTATYAWRRSKLCFCVPIFVLYLVYPVTCQEHTLATFYGAYQRIKPAPTDTGLNVMLNFKAAAPTGLLLAARLDREGSNAGFIAIGIRNGHIVTQISQQNTPTSPVSSNNSTLQADVWYAISIHIVNTSVTVELRRGEDVVYFSTHTLSSLLTVRDVYLGGANSFFSRAFTSLDITEYFLGCLANGSINDRVIDFLPKVAGYGMEYGCCPNPEPITWSFIAGRRNSFDFDSRLAHMHFQTDTFVLSFLIQPQHDGMVFYSQNEGDEFALAVELFNSQLLVYLTNERDHYQPHSLTCEGSPIDGWRHNVIITILQDSLECSIDGAMSQVNTSHTSLPSDSMEYHAGSATSVSTHNTNLLLFQSNLRTVPDDGMFPSFGGSLQKFQLNGLDVAPPFLTPSSPSLSVACPTRPELLQVCQQLRDVLSMAELARVTLETATVSLKENATMILTDEHLILHLPEVVTRADVEEAFANSIQFSVISRPSHGELINISHPHQPIVQFSYTNLLNRTIAYRHDGEEFPTDSLRLNVTSICSNAFSQVLTVDFAVRLTNDYPVVSQQDVLSIAVGTRRMITSDIITVTDEESTNLINISFRVLNIFVDGCDDCGTAGRIERAASPGFGSRDFNQREINNGDVAFQHFGQFGTQPITIRLRVSDMVLASIEIALHVTPYVGRVTLTRNEPLPIIEGRCGYITTEHLSATTDFNVQNPTLQYSVTGAPEHGRLDVKDQGHWRPILGPNIVFEGFTQENVDQNLVRYCHRNESLARDVFQFRLHSTLLEGSEGNFTINVFTYEDLQQPTVTLTTSPLTLPEGRQVTIQSDTLAVSLARSVRPPWSRDKITVEELGIFFRLERQPRFGEIFLNGKSLSAEMAAGFSLDDLVGGVVSYRHDDTENHEDFVSIQVESLDASELPIKSPNLPPLTNLTLHIIPVNDHTPVITTTRIAPSEGRFITLTPGVLNVTDGDLPRQTVVLTILSHNPDYGFFALSDPAATPVENFTSDDIDAGVVYYQHRFEPSLPLNHTVQVEASDGERSSQWVIEIAAKPLIINTSNVPTEDCIADLDAVDPSLTVPISRDPFISIEIYDEHGIDTDRLWNMVLRIAQYPTHGRLLKGDGEEPITEFTLSDLTNQLVRYRFLNRTDPATTDMFHVEISYGNSIPVVVPFHVCIDPVPTPVQVIIRSISLATSTSVLIDNGTFQAEDSRGRGGDAITYSIIHQPQWGRVVNQTNHTLTTFTQAAIDQNTIFYQHLNQSSSSTLKDYFIFTLCTPYVCRGQYNATVTFSITNLTVYNHGLRVDEGGRAYITKDRLDAVAPQGDVRIHIMRQPSRGQLFLSGGGDFLYPDPKFFDTQDIARRAVWYDHSGTEKYLDDSFTFSVTAANSERISGVFSITVNPINNKLPHLSRKEFYVIARTTYNITCDDLYAFDEDSDVDSHTLRYNVTISPIHGVIHFRNDTSHRQSLSVWYERDVRKGLLAYTHTAQQRLNREILDIVAINIYDRNQYRPQIIKIHINEITLTVTETSLEVVEGGEGTIGRDNLIAESNGDDSITDSDLKFHLTLLPRYGNLTLRGRPVTNFTQADLFSSGLVYRHDHSNTVFDKFNYSVTIAQHDAMKTGTLEIDVSPIDDDPPTLVFHHKPLFVIEGGEINIISDYIEVIDFDTDMTLATQTNQIQFQIISGPRHGAVKRRQGAAGNKFRTTEVFTLYEVNLYAVRFESHHEQGDDMWYDSFLVNLTDGDNTHDTPYNFSFIILPDIISVKATPFLVPEGGSVVLPSDTIIALHPYLTTQLGGISVHDPPKNGTLYNSATGQMNISEFTTADLVQGYIEYHHNDAEKERDRLTFTYEAHQPINPDGMTQPGYFPDRFLRTSDVVSLEILVETVNDRGPVVRSNNTLVMWAEDCAFLSVRHLDVFDADTPDNKLIYTFNFTFDAYISHINNSNSIVIDSFTQEDVVNSIIKLFHRSGDVGIMYYTVTDGQFSVSSLLRIETHRLEIVVLNNKPLNVSMEGMVLITSDALKVRRSNTNSTIPLCYFDETVEFIFEAKYGAIIVNGSTDTTSFTDLDITRGLVYYQHTRPELWEPLEILKLKAKAQLTKFKEIYLNITINLPSEPNSPLAVHKPLLVDEGGQACLNESILDARNVRYNATKETFNNTLTSWFHFYISETSHGEILVNGKPPRKHPVIVSQDQIANGSVCYRNFGDESPEVLIEFSVIIFDSDGYHRGGDTDLILEVFVTLLNDEAPIVVSSNLVMTVVEGFSSCIRNDSLLVYDEDNPATDLVFTVINLPPGGQLWFGGERLLQENDNFTQAMVNEGKLSFKALDIGMWKTLLSFTDGKFLNQTNFTVEIDEHFIKVERTEVLRYSQNENGAHLTPKHVVVSTNGNVNDTVYYLVERPQNGELKGLTRDGFTQNDLQLGRVLYAPTNYKAHSDSFKLDVRNREAENQTITIEVRVGIWGQIRQNKELDFDNVDDRSLPLPKNLLRLSNLQILLQRPPKILITQQPRLGFLEVKIPTSSFQLQRRSTISRSDLVFSYDFLDYEWVYYTWNATNVSLIDTDEAVNDSFSVLVEGYEGIQPGEATIALCIKNPPPLSPERVPPVNESPIPSETTNFPTPFQEDEEGSGGFPNYALLPILGVFLCLLLIIVVVIYICITQQGRIRKRWQPRMPGNHWNQPPQNFSLQPSTNLYDIEPSSRTEAVTNLSEMVDHGTEYPEVHSSLSRHSPQSRYSPLVSHHQLYHHQRHMIPRPRSRRSNVSVSYSHHPSSEVTLDGLPRGRHHAFSPPPLMSRYATPTTVEPGSRCSSEYDHERGEGESGYLSTPNPSITAGDPDEPVRLVLRRPVVEQVSPLPRLLDDEEGERGREEVGHDSTEGEEGAVGGTVEDREEVNSSRNEEIVTGDAAERPGLEQQTADHKEQTSQQNGEEHSATPNDQVAMQTSNSNGAHAVDVSSPRVGTSPPLPLPAASDPVGSSADSTHNSNQQASASDLHTLFRTHNPILKPTEYWV